MFKSNYLEGHLRTTASVLSWKFCRNIVYQKNRYNLNNIISVKHFFTIDLLKGTVMQIEKALINERFHVSKIS